MKKLLVSSLSSLCVLGMTTATGAAASSAAPLITHQPMIRAKMPTLPHGKTNGHGHGGGGSGGGGGTATTYGWYASNWSGYALSNTGPYNSITGTWTVPTVNPSAGNTYSSTWVGIDGFNNSDLIQTGTEQDYASGAAQYYAWWEILPAAETVITTADGGVPATVSPGDSMYADIQNLGTGQWSITLKDITKGWTFSTTQAYSGPASSAEWIEEAPAIGGHISTLANYGSATLDPGSVNGGDPHFTASEDGAMVQHKTLVSVPSLPDTFGDGFNVAYGSVQPTPPPSS